MSTQECLDAYEIVQGLVTHPGLKPHQRRQAEALLKDIKANLENSDDEGETSRPDDQQMGPAQTPPRPTPAISAAPRQTQAAAIRTKAHQFPPRESAHSEKPGAQRDLGALASKPQSTGISGDMERALNSRGLRTFLSAEGDQFLASITASQNTHMSPPTAPALDTRPPQAPRPEPNSRPAQAPHANLGPSLSPRPRQPDVHEPTQRPTKYRFDNVRLEGMENDVAAKKARVGSPGSDDDADGSTDDGDNSDQPPARPPVPVVLDHGLGHTRPFQCGPRQPPAHRLPGTEFMTQDMFRNYTIPRDRTQGPSANAQQERPKDRSGGTSAHSTVARSARSPSVELFVSGQLLPMQEVNRWNTELSTGISWTIESAEKSLKNIVFILDTLPQMISSHPPISREKSPNLWSDIGHLHQLCVSENILKVAGSLSLITPDMVDMGKITTKAPGKDGHILAPNLANFFAPPKVAYTRLKSTLEQSWSTLHFSDVKNQWVQQAFDDKNGVYSAYAHFCQSYENLGTTPSAPNTTCLPISHGLGSNILRCDGWPGMLANLLIFGPTAAFTSLRKSQFVSLANANAMLELGSSVLKQKLALGISAPMPHSTFDNLRLHFLNFLVRMGFTQLDKDGVPNVDWKQVHKAFYNDFSPLVVSQLVSQDVEIALEHRLG
ncbi:hypothetical protein PSHT_11838 [Puccinia striiformis]|uniref:Uncharacterized protein n=3 Tax=Puccinia striiformis TaxID=27350 RepID=A0A2S4V0M8_9BASI|nr:hypothetical protein PSHT_11838 [Puccinia striiformis]